MHPDELPVTKILAGSASYLAMAQLIMVARPVLSPPPLRIKLLLLATSQQLLSFGELGKRTMKPLVSARELYLVDWK